MFVYLHLFADHNFGSVGLKYDQDDACISVCIYSHIFYLFKSISIYLYIGIVNDAKTVPCHLSGT